MGKSKKVVTTEKSNLNPDGSYRLTGSKKRLYEYGTPYVTPEGNVLSSGTQRWRYVMTPQRPGPAQKGGMIKQKTANTNQRVRSSTAGLAADVQAIIASIALPHDYPAIRMSDVYSGRPTAVANPFTINNLDVTAAAATTANNGTFSIMAFRDTLRNALVTVHNIPQGTAAVAYPVFFVAQTVDTALTLYFNIHYGAPIDLPLAQAQTAGTLQLHGPVLYAGVHGQRRGIWMNTGERIVFADNQSAMSTADTEFIPSILTGNTWVVSGTFLASSSSAATYTAVQAGYVSFTVNDFRAQTSAYIGLSATLYGPTGSGSYDGWAQLCVEDVPDHSGSIAAVRVIGTSILLTNTANVLNNNGNVAITQVDPGEDVAAIASHQSTMYNLVSNDVNSYVGQWVNGVYGFLKPSGPTDMDMRHPFRFDPETDLMVDSSFPLVPVSGFLLATFTVGQDAGASTFSSGKGFYVVANALEFATEDIWFSSVAPSVSYSAYQNALQFMKGMGQFDENPLHWKDILAMIKKAGSELLRIAPELADLIAAFNPNFAPAALAGSAVAKAMRAHGHRAPK